MARIIRLYMVGTIPFGRLLEMGQGKLYLKTETVGLPVESVEQADAELAKMMSSQSTVLNDMMAPPPYKNLGYAVSFKAVGLLGIQTLPDGVPTPQVQAQVS